MKPLSMTIERRGRSDPAQRARSAESLEPPRLRVGDRQGWAGRARDWPCSNAYIQRQHGDTLRAGVRITRRLDVETVLTVRVGQTPVVDDTAGVGARPGAQAVVNQAAGVQNSGIGHGECMRPSDPPPAMLVGADRCPLTADRHRCELTRPNVPAERSALLTPSQPPVPRLRQSTIPWDSYLIRNKVTSISHLRCL